MSGTYAVVLEVARDACRGTPKHPVSSIACGRRQEGKLESVKMPDAEGRSSQAVDQLHFAAPKWCVALLCLLAFVDQLHLAAARWCVALHFAAATKVFLSHYFKKKKKNAFIHPSWCELDFAQRSEGPQGPRRVISIRARFAPTLVPEALGSRSRVPSRPGTGRWPSFPWRSCYGSVRFLGLCK